MLGKDATATTFNFPYHIVSKRSGFGAVANGCFDDIQSAESFYLGQVIEECLFLWSRTGQRNCIVSSSSWKPFAVCRLTRLRPAYR